MSLGLKRRIIGAEFGAKVERQRERERKESKARINRSPRSPCVRLYSCDPIITDRRETITSPRRAASVVPSSAIFYFCPGNTDARLIFFNHGRAASRAVYRGFLTREIHRSRSLFLLARCARASGRVSVRVSPDSPLYTSHEIPPTSRLQPLPPPLFPFLPRPESRLDPGFFPRFFTPRKQHACDCFREIKNRPGLSLCRWRTNFYFALPRVVFLVSE